MQSVLTRPNIIADPDVAAALVEQRSAKEAWNKTREVGRVDGADGDPRLRRHLVACSTSLYRVILDACAARDAMVDAALPEAEAVRDAAAAKLAEVRKTDPWTDGPEAHEDQRAKQNVDALLALKGESKTFRVGRAKDYAWGWQ